jgi:hypothetical protein
VGAAAAHGVAALVGVSLWECPVRHTLGIPCPGCGLSRATGTLLHGDWQTSLTYHAFAPLLLLSLLVIGVISLLPSARREQAIAGVKRLETHTGLVAIGLVGLMVYWAVRLLVYREAFIILVVG